MIVEVAQVFMKTPQQVGRKNSLASGRGAVAAAILMIADKDGNLRLVAVPLE